MGEKKNSENDDDLDDDSDESHGTGERKDNYCYDVVGGPRTRIAQRYIIIILLSYYMVPRYNIIYRYA